MMMGDCANSKVIKMEKVIFDQPGGSNVYRLWLWQKILSVTDGVTEPEF